MNGIKTDPELIKKLKEVAGRPMTAEEIKKQRISFIMGSLSHDSKITRKQVEEILDKAAGL